MRSLTFVTVILTIGIVAAGAAQERAQIPAPATTDTYVWTGVLVSFEDATRTMTAKVRIFGPQALGEPGRFKPGDRVSLSWLGYDAHADHVREVVPDDATRRNQGSFQFPAEFVSAEEQNNYVTVKFHVPASASVTLKALKPGDWVRVRSRQNPSNETDTVVDVKPFMSLAQ